MASKSKILLGLAFVGLVCLSFPSGLLADSGACATPGNLVTNCGFESGDFTGWTVVDASGFTLVMPTGFHEYNASSGNFFAALGAVGADGSVSQTLSTVAGETYDFTFFLAGDGEAPNDFSAFFGSDLVYAATDLGTADTFDLTPFSFDVTATSSSTTITFLGRDDQGWLALDDVSVVAATPEPGSLGLLATGLFGMLGWLKRVRK